MGSGLADDQPRGPAHCFFWDSITDYAPSSGLRTLGVFALLMPRNAQAGSCSLETRGAAIPPPPLPQYLDPDHGAGPLARPGPGTKPIPSASGLPTTPTTPRILRLRSDGTCARTAHPFFFEISDSYLVNRQPIPGAGGFEEASAKKPRLDRFKSYTAYPDWAHPLRMARWMAYQSRTRGGRVVKREWLSC